jgi:hypothetical protein
MVLELVGRFRAALSCATQAGRGPGWVDLYPAFPHWAILGSPSGRCGMEPGLVFQSSRRAQFCPHSKKSMPLACSLLSKLLIPN